MKPDMELALPARAENIAIVRHALGGLGEVFAISEEKLSDIRLAVTEACSNVVMHAYPENGAGRSSASPSATSTASSSTSLPSTASSSTTAPPSAVSSEQAPSGGPHRRAGWGMMEVSATMAGDELAVAVRDWGAGIRPRPDSPGLGLGLSLIAALAETVRLGHDTAEHTEVHMTFALSLDGRVSAADGIGAPRTVPWSSEDVRGASDGHE